LPGAGSSVESFDGAEIFCGHVKANGNREGAMTQGELQEFLANIAA
jgi:hypothetical protein